MSKSVRNALIAGGAVAVLAIAAVVVFVVRPGSPAQVKIVDFIQQSYPVAIDGTDVREAPDASSSSIARLRQGITINVLGIVDGNAWLQVEMPDKRIGYVAAAAIPGATVASAGKPAAAPAGTAPADNAQLEFAADTNILRVASATKAYIAPSDTAPNFYTLGLGTRVQTAAKSNNSAWVVVMTEDGRAAFLRTADLVALRSDGTGDGLPASVSGQAKVIDTATLLVNDQTVYLSGVKGCSGTYASQMQGLIDSKGQAVDCQRHGEDYVCLVSGGLDLARTSLYNGGSKASDSATDDYRQQEAHAKSAKLGVWK